MEISQPVVVTSLPVADESIVEEAKVVPSAPIITDDDRNAKRIFYLALTSYFILCFGYGLVFGGYLMSISLMDHGKLDSTCSAFVVSGLVLSTLSGATLLYIYKGIQRGVWTTLFVSALVMQIAGLYLHFNQDSELVYIGMIAVSNIMITILIYMVKFFDRHGSAVRIGCKLVFWVAFQTVVGGVLSASLRNEDWMFYIYIAFTVMVVLVMTAGVIETRIAAQAIPSVYKNF